MRQQRGGNIVGFRGARIQRGYGIGGIRIAIPSFKRSAKAVGKRELKAATKVGQDVLEEKNVIKSTKSRGKQAVNDIAEAAATKVVIGVVAKSG